MNYALVLAATAVSLVAGSPAAVTERDCDAVRLSSGTYFISYMQLSSSLKASPGQTITATIVVRIWQPRSPSRLIHCFLGQGNMCPI